MTSTAAGVGAFVATWLVLLRFETEIPDILEPVGACSYGFALGSVTSGVYLARGGRSLDGAVWASLMATVVISGALAILMTLSAAGVVPFYALPLLGAVIFGVLLLIAAVVLVVPATLATLAVFGIVYALQTLIDSDNDRQEA